LVRRTPTTRHRVRRYTEQSQEQHQGQQVPQQEQHKEQVPQQQIPGVIDVDISVAEAEELKKEYFFIALSNAPRYAMRTEVQSVLEQLNVMPEYMVRPLDWKQKKASRTQHTQERRWFLGYPNKQAADQAFEKLHLRQFGLDKLRAHYVGFKTAPGIAFDHGLLVKNISQELPLDEFRKWITCEWTRNVRRTIQVCQTPLELLLLSRSEGQRSLMLIRKHQRLWNGQHVTITPIE